MGLTGVVIVPVFGIKVAIRKARMENTAEGFWTFSTVVVVFVALCGGFILAAAV